MSSRFSTLADLVGPAKRRRNARQQCRSWFYLLGGRRGWSWFRCCRWIRAWFRCCRNGLGGFRNDAAGIQAGDFSRAETELFENLFVVLAEISATEVAGLY